MRNISLRGILADDVTLFGDLTEINLATLQHSGKSVERSWITHPAIGGMSDTSNQKLHLSVGVESWSHTD